jgi:hypothetical protein
MRRLNNSFVHGALAYSAYAWAPLLLGKAAWIVAALLCLYAGWCRQAYLASFLGGVIVAVVGWTAIGILSSPEVGVGVFFMVPFALSVILPTALAGYLLGRVIFALVRRRSGGPEPEA